MDIIVIGAGPAGSTIAYELAKKGHNVSVYENHATCGDPIQCTGILTATINKMIHIPKDVVAKKIHDVSIEVYGEHKAKAKFRLQKAETIVYRNNFDQFLQNRAEKEGVQYFFGHTFIEFKKGKARFSTEQGHCEINTDFLIGSDGVHSKVRDIINHKKIKKFIGMQELVEAKKTTDSYEAFFSSELGNSFGWIVPEEKGYRVGIATQEKGKERYEHFIQDVVKKRIGKSKHKSWQSGFIPVYEPSLTILKDNVAIVGDAATHVKATTLGGIIPAMKAGQELAEHIHSQRAYLHNKDLQIHKELNMHLRLRHMLDKASPKDLATCISLLGHASLQKTFASVPRDELMKSKYKLLLPAIAIALQIHNWPFFVRMLKNVST